MTASKDCARRVYPKLEGEELEKRQTFSRDFPSWATQLQSMWSFTRLRTISRAQEEAKKELMSFGSWPEWHSSAVYEGRPLKASKWFFLSLRL